MVQADQTIPLPHGSKCKTTRPTVVGLRLVTLVAAEGQPRASEGGILNERPAREGRTLSGERIRGQGGD